jgi:hypothetical protein
MQPVKDSRVETAFFAGAGITGFRPETPEEKLPVSDLERMAKVGLELPRSLS